MSFDEAKEVALGELQTKTVALLLQAKEQLKNHVSGILTDPVRAGNDQPYRVMVTLKEYMEAPIECQVKRMTRSQSDALVVQMVAQVMVLFQDKIKSALAEVRRTATSSAEAIALERVEQRSNEGKQRLLQYFQEAIEAFQNQRMENTANVTAIQQHVTSIMQLVADFQQWIKRRVKTSRRRVDASVNNVFDQRSANLEQSVEIIVDMKLAGIQSAQPIASTDEAAVAGIVGAVTSAIDRLGQSMERGFKSMRQTLER